MAQIIIEPPTYCKGVRKIPRNSAEDNAALIGSMVPASDAFVALILLMLFIYSPKAMIVPKNATNTVSKITGAISGMFILLKNTTVGAKLNGTEIKPPMIKPQLITGMVPCFLINVDVTSV